MSNVISGTRVLGVLAATVVATAVLPPAGAYWLNARRIAMTTERVTAAAARVDRLERQDVVCGPGRLPDPGIDGAPEAHVAWLTAATVQPEAFGPGMPTDAWGRCFLMNDRWLLSAGPNGAIDTPLGGDLLVGDDIGARLK